MNAMPNLTPTLMLDGLGRLLALLLTLFWGAFLVEHFREWFVPPGVLALPFWVWTAQALHLSMVLGLAIMIVKPRLGIGITLVATVGFFSVIGMNRFPTIALLNAMPIACFLMAALLGGRREGPASRDAGPSVVASP